MTAKASITRRITLSVLLVELLAAVVLIATVTNHERKARFETFEANLRATANALLGAVQEADARDGSVVLDLAGVSLPPAAIYSVAVDNGQVLGAHGVVPSLSISPGTATKAWVEGRPYRFYALKGERVIDPGRPNERDHQVTVVYGLVEGPTWDAIFKATRYFAFATFLLLGSTAILLLWLIRRSLLPIHELAEEAGKIDAERWTFQAPARSRQFIELEPLASAIEKTVARLHRSFDQQRRFTSDAAHELKTDLAIIKSSVQLLSMKRRTVEEYEHGLFEGLGDIARMETTVQKMLTLARLEQAPKDEQYTNDLIEVVRDVVEQSQPFAAFKQIRVKYDGVAGQTEVCLSKDDLLLLCSNVLINAIQHSPERSEVTLAVLRDADRVELRVRDYGSGVSNKDLPFLFDAFYRGDESRSRKSGGTGLGLSICKAICDRAGGSIDIANHPEGGAVVTIRLPVGPQQIEHS